VRQRGRLLAGLDDYPAYYAWMAPANAAGPAAPDLTPRPVSGADQIARRIASSPPPSVT
jgi:hydroxyacylglutathione hydrolase